MSFRPTLLWIVWACTMGWLGFVTILLFNHHQHLKADLAKVDEIILTRHTRVSLVEELQASFQNFMNVAHQNVTHLETFITELELKRSASPQEPVAAPVIPAEEVPLPPIREMSAGEREILLQRYRTCSAAFPATAEKLKALKNRMDQQISRYETLRQEWSQWFDPVSGKPLKEQIIRGHKDLGPNEPG